MVTRGRAGFRGQFDDPLRDLPQLSDEDRVEEPPEAHYRRQADRIRAQLQAEDPSIDPAWRARLVRELAEWEKMLDAATIGGHWASGEGDRRLC